MSSEVYFAQRRATQNGGLLEKLEQLFDAAGLGALVPEGGGLVAIKFAFGLPGTLTSLRPAYLQRVVHKLKHHGARPFLTDTLPLGPAGAPAGVDQLHHAMTLGYGLGGHEAPLVMADGLRGRDAVALAAGPEGEGVAVASALAHADAVVGLGHVTGHEHAGLAGALWNIGWGGAALEGKRWILAGLEAEGPRGYQARMVEAAAALARSRRMGYVNLLVDLTPDPDYLGWSDAPIVADIGVLASRDPVAIDQASADLLLQAPGIGGTRLMDVYGKDKLRELYPAVEWAYALDHAERLGLGKRDYELMII